MTGEATTGVTETPDPTWHRIDEADLPAEGRIRSVVVDGRSVAVSRCGGHLGALENRCPHQGGPLGEGSIEKGWLRCPWHGYDYRPDHRCPAGGVRRRGSRRTTSRSEPTAPTSRSPDRALPTRTVADTVGRPWSRGA